MSEEFRNCSSKGCGKLLPLSEFKLVKSHKKQYYHSLCLQCYRKKDKEYKKKKYSDPEYRAKTIERNKKYIAINKEIKKQKFKEISQRYYKKHKDKILEKTKNYYKNNKKFYKKYQKEYEKISPRYKRGDRIKNINFKIKQAITRSVLSRLIKLGNLNTENDLIMNSLGVSVLEFKNYFESLFEPWMNWDNHGPYNTDSWNDDDQSTWVWNIDHIIPHSEFKYTSIDDDSFKECWNLNNLRPYSAKQNIIDGATKIRHRKDKK
jgi:hypothetical protein